LYRRILETAAAKLYFLPSVIGNGANVGLYEGTLFDVLDINNGTGNVTVEATGFNISCGYLTDVDNEFIFDEQLGLWGGNCTVGGAVQALEIYNTHKPIK
jgi:hypothetical protein